MGPTPIRRVSLSMKVPTLLYILASLREEYYQLLNFRSSFFQNICGVIMLNEIVCKKIHSIEIECA